MVAIEGFGSPEDQNSNRDMSADAAFTACEVTVHDESLFVHGAKSCLLSDTVNLYRQAMEHAVKAAERLTTEKRRLQTLVALAARAAEDAQVAPSAEEAAKHATIAAEHALTANQAYSRAIQVALGTELAQNWAQAAGIEFVRRTNAAHKDAVHELQLASFALDADEAMGRAHVALQEIFDRTEAVQRSAIRASGAATVASESAARACAAAS